MSASRQPAPVSPVAPSNVCRAVLSSSPVVDLSVSALHPKSLDWMASPAPIPHSRLYSTAESFRAASSGKQQDLRPEEKFAAIVAGRRGQQTPRNISCASSSSSESRAVGSSTEARLGSSAGAPVQSEWCTAHRLPREQPTDGRGASSSCSSGVSAGSECCCSRFWEFQRLWDPEPPGQWGATKIRGGLDPPPWVDGDSGEAIGRYLPLQ